MKKFFSYGYYHYEGSVAYINKECPKELLAVIEADLITLRRQITFRLEEDRRRQVIVAEVIRQLKGVEAPDALKVLWREKIEEECLKFYQLKDFISKVGEYGIKVEADTEYVHYNGPYPLYEDENVRYLENEPHNCVCMHYMDRVADVNAQRFMRPDRLITIECLRRYVSMYFNNSSYKSKV